MATPPRAHPPATAKDIAALPEGTAAEVIDGELVPKAAPSSEHGSAQFALSGVLFRPFGSDSRGEGPPQWWLMTEVEVEYEPHEIYRHDLVGWRRDRHPTRPGGFPV